MGNIKQCSRCREERPAAQFSNCAANKDGLHRWCKSCNAEHGRLKRGTADRVRKNTLAVLPQRWQRAEGEVGGKVCTACLKFQLLEVFSKAKTGQFGRMPMCKLCTNRYRNARRKETWSEKQWADQLEKLRAWRSKNPKRLSFHKHNHEARRRSQLATGFVDHKDLRRLLNRHQGRCFYCSAPADTFDHVVPLVRGGRHTIGNLLPACRSCNSRKRHRMLVEWRQHTVLKVA